jgi:ribosome recycling factor
MPTGYTERLATGKDDSFENFALQCSRAIGTMMHMRDDPMDAPIRLRKEDDYYSESLKQAEAALQDLEKMSIDEIDAYAEKVREEQVAQCEKSLSDMFAVEKRYNTMTGKVNSWNCSQEFESLRNFMNEQLTQGKEADCNEQIKKMYIKGLETIQQKKSRDIWNDAMAVAKRDVEYFTEHLTNDSASINDSNEWIGKLHDSLNIPRPEHD